MNAPVKAESLQIAPSYRRRYVTVRAKFAIALTVALIWTTFSVWAAFCAAKKAKKLCFTR